MLWHPFNTCIEIEPNFGGAYYNLGYIYGELKKLQLPTTLNILFFVLFINALDICIQKKNITI